MPKTINIDKKLLEDLYLKEKKSSYEISIILSCSPSLIRKRLKEYGIKSRSIQEAKSLMKPRYPRKDFNGDFEEKAYLIGFRIGDLHIRKTHPNSPTIRVSTNTTKEAQCALFKELFSKYGHVKQYNRDKNGATSIRAFVNSSFSFLLEKDDKIADWILQNNTYFLNFLAGYIDAEGSFCIYNGYDGVFSIRSQDKNILWSIYVKLRKKGVLCRPPKLVWPAGEIRRNIKNNKDVWGLFIYRKDSLAELIKLLKPLVKHKKRYKDMLSVEQNINDRNIKYGFKKDNRWYKTY